MNITVRHDHRGEPQLYAELSKLNRDRSEPLSRLDDGEGKFAAGKKAGLFAVYRDQIRFRKNLKQILLLQCLNLTRSDRVGDGCAARRSRDVVIHGRDCAMWLANFAPSRPQPFKSLG